MTPRFPIRRPRPMPTPPPRSTFAICVWLFFVYLGLLGIISQLSGIKDAIRSNTAAAASRPLAQQPADLHAEIDRLRTELGTLRASTLKARQ